MVPPGTLTHFSMYSPLQPFQSLMWNSVLSARRSDRLKRQAVPDGREADVEAPAAFDTFPESALEVDAEPDQELVLALDDGVVLVLVVDIEDVGVPLGHEVPGR